MPTKTATDTHLLTTLATAMHQELVSNLVPFWLQQQDPRGGFFSAASFHNECNRAAPKSVLLNSRILWFFARAARQLGDTPLAADCYSAAQHSYEFMRRHCLDQQNGGLFWLVDAQGNTLDRQKHLYNQAFAVYALAEWYQSSQSAEALALAEQVQQTIRAQHDATHGGYLEAFDEHWQPIPNRLICDTEKTVAAKSMNTHLHILEAFSRLYDIQPSAELAAALIELLAILTDKVLNIEHSFAQFFSQQWQVVSHNHSFGHDIEGAWLLWEAGQKVLTGQAQQQLKHTLLAMADQVYHYGRDVDGALFNQWQRQHLLDSTRIWWVQAEAVTGFVHAWQASGQSRYLQAAQQCWQWIAAHLIDRRHGEWHAATNRFGHPDPLKAKVSGWKCPYHNGRACLEISELAGIN